VNKKELSEYFAQQGSRGGKARADKLTPAKKKAIAKKAAAARWGKKGK
jgi:hypothetical protein